jgi:carbonic anhydrase
VESGDMPPGFLRDIVERVAPSVLHANRQGRSDLGDIVRDHVAETARLLASRSAVINEYVADGRVAIVAAQYDLAHGRVQAVESVGEVTVDAADNG